jgi:hypothetical protein
VKLGSGEAPSFQSKLRHSGDKGDEGVSVEDCSFHRSGTILVFVDSRCNKQNRELLPAYTTTLCRGPDEIGNKENKISAEMEEAQRGRCAVEWCRSGLFVCKLPSCVDGYFL